MATIENNKRKTRSGGKIVLENSPPPTKKAKAKAKSEKGNGPSNKPVVVIVIDETKCCNCGSTTEKLIKGPWGGMCFGCMLCMNKYMCICNYSDQFELWFLEENERDSKPLLTLAVGPTHQGEPNVTFDTTILWDICQFLEKIVSIEDDKLNFARLYCRGTISFGLRYNLLNIPHPDDWKSEFGREYDSNTEFTTNKDLKLFYASFMRFIRLMFEMVEVRPVCNLEHKVTKDGNMYLETVIGDEDEEMPAHLKSMAKEMLQCAREDLKDYMDAMPTK